MNKPFNDKRSPTTGRPRTRNRIISCISILILTAPLPLRTAAPEPLAPPLAEKTADGFAVPQPGRQSVFPRDHGSHPEFKIEWWYITGHLFTDPGKKRYGFQATFFRQAAPPLPVATPVAQSSSFRLDQVHLAHMALLDVQEGRFLSQERFHRAGWNADAATNTLSLRNGNWSLRLTDPTAERMELRGAIRAEASFQLQLEPAKPLVVFGQDGVSRKAAAPTAASYYLTFPRLTVNGTLKVGDRSEPVTGQAWMDHEISSSQLSSDQVGWDWASLQLRDQREIMVYRLRRKNGQPDPFSTLSWVEATGEVTQQTASQFSWDPESNWTSPATGAIYPLPVRITCLDPQTDERVIFRLMPLAKEQEWTGEVGGIAYWEGACRVLNDTGREVGSAFMELTGYADDLSKRFQ